MSCNNISIIILLLLIVTLISVVEYDSTRSPLMSSVYVNNSTNLSCHSDRNVVWFFTSTNATLKSHRSLRSIPISYQNPLEIHLAEPLVDGYYYCFSQTAYGSFLSYTMLKVYGKT